ncbi:aldehyde dehydrogenase family protein [Amycolatopsis sp. NEAU-NG30]|uniref:Aldehyde dehydrogenase family protein n=1 Tax=Amycolatopsis melonis TaxID=3156488 RepID=A0ABV0L7Y3_9PSEU
MTFTREKLFIGGRWVDPRSDAGMPVLNPATGTVIGSAPLATAQDAAGAVDAARRAFDEGPWPGMSPKERAGFLRGFADAMERHRAELVELTVAEAGVVAAQADGMHLRVSIEMALDYADRILPRFPFMDPVNPMFGQSMTGLPQITQGVITREPVGVASLITPFNAPIALSAAKLIPALASGCTVVLKPSPYTPLEVLALGEIVEEAGFPPGVVNIISGDTDVSVEMTTNPAVDIISFTGSDAVGRKILAQAADDLKKVVLELGGKSANVVFADADLDRAALEIVGNTVFSCGQGCLLTTRTLVEKSVYDEVVAKAVAMLPAVNIGDPTDPATGMGPVIREKERDRIEAMIKTGVAEGARIAYGGGRPDHLPDGYFLEPTLLVDVDNTMSVARKEIFGPVNAVIPFTDEAGAVRIANDSPYGLNASVFTGDVNRAWRVAKQIRSGTVNINNSFTPNPDAPFGGYKHSGIGREGGAFAMTEYLEQKSVTWLVGHA